MTDDDEIIDPARLNLHKDAEYAAERAANAVIHYLNGLNLEDPEVKNFWVKGVFDKVMSR
ncbi:MAG TPA: hypothetical protein VHT24_08510 [Pseudacidobacterium sp.]|jgi:hypothetical protein|nr:hypothetical protein [Pseudacidobacterium sp.]